MKHHKGVRANFKVAGSQGITAPRTQISELKKKKGARGFQHPVSHHRFLLVKSMWCIFFPFL